LEPRGRSGRASARARGYPRSFRAEPLPYFTGRVFAIHIDECTLVKGLRGLEPRGRSGENLADANPDRSPGYLQITTSPQRGSKSSFAIASMCTTRRWIPANASTNQGPEKGDEIPLCVGRMLMLWGELGGREPRPLPGISASGFRV